MRGIGIHDKTTAPSPKIPTVSRQVEAQMLQLLVVDPLHGRGKQIFHPYPHTSLPHISCIVTPLGILGKFRICGNAFVFQESDDAANLGVKCFEIREYFLKYLFGGEHLLKHSRVYFHLILQ